uniref:PPM-type phosphatase domain-containing protein n=1 Tax=Kalanchoe fedtschenkoi TaxID=63787 RepID=A0A7N0VI25_KALFE
MFPFTSLIQIVLGFQLITRCYGESSTCLMLYKEGGAPAVFQSPKCPRWKLSSHGDSQPPVCHTAMQQGRRKTQEDRVFCNLDVRIPFPGASGIRDVMVGIVAVFDGHNGAEASDMASKLFLEYFLLHTYFLLDSTYSLMLGKSMLPNKEYHAKLMEHNLDESANDRDKSQLLSIFDESFCLNILKQSLLRAIHDIDATFSKEASKRTLDSGTTATIILLADDHILAANIGDSKALLCSEKVQSPADAKATLLRIYAEKRRKGLISRSKGHNSFEVMTSKGLAHLVVKELTRDHHPDRDDEKSRVETAGGFVYDTSGVPRVNGKLAVSRAIGDLSFKRYGVISSPEITDWQQLTANDSYLVVASDGLFESLSTQDVCDLLWETEKHDNTQSQLSVVCSYALADCLVNTAFSQGSTDNIATAVVPLRAPTLSPKSAEEKCGLNGKEPLVVDTHALVSGQPLRSISSRPALLEQPSHPVLTKFNRLLVEGKHGVAGCFYVFENLTHEVDYMIHPEMPIVFE